MKNAPTNRALAILIARWILGLIFFMAGWYKVFQLGPIGHAHKFFVDPYRDSFLPMWSLWAAGTTVPFVELVAGALVMAGWYRRPAYIGLGAVLVKVTFGHLLAMPLYEFHTHVIPRTMLLLFVMVMPAAEDTLSADEWLGTRRGGRL